MNKVLISGTSSGVGKTTVTTAILSLLDNPAPFKCGPDYIDPMFHKYITNTDSINLDLFMLDENTLKYLFKRRSENKNISVLEGMMGLYDGLNHELDNYSAAHISRVLKVPVILVVDGTKISTSIAAVVKGFQEFDRRVEIKGVIINKVREGLYHYLKEAIEKHTNVKCLGYLPDDESIAISERHLGLMQVSEINDLNNKLIMLKEIAKETIDIKSIKEIAVSDEIYCENIDDEYINRFKGLKVGVAKDLAFSFYYQDNIELMKKSGMILTYFSPMNDSRLPDVDCLYIGGGYPEVYASELSNNRSMIDDIRKFSSDGKLIYAECGGMMYLSRSIINDDSKHEMCGIFDHSVKMQESLNIKRFGYIKCQNNSHTVNAHEFHYSDIVDLTLNEEYYFNILKGTRNWKCGFRKHNTIAGYPHIHFYSNLEFFNTLFKEGKI
ncbi:cobyrinate a,c-diamide synthase [Mycoplasmatota bacterium WC44]